MTVLPPDQWTAEQLERLVLACTDPRPVETWAESNAALAFRISERAAWPLAPVARQVGRRLDDLARWHLSRRAARRAGG